MEETKDIIVDRQRGKIEEKVQTNTANGTLAIAGVLTQRRFCVHIEMCTYDIPTMLATNNQCRQAKTRERHWHCFVSSVLVYESCLCGVAEAADHHSS